MNFMKNKMVQRVTALVLSLSLIMSCFVFAGFGEGEIVGAQGGGTDQTANTDIIRSGGLTYTTTTGTTAELNDNTTLPDINLISKFTATYNFKIKDIVGGDGSYTQNVNTNDYYIIKLPTEFDAIKALGTLLAGSGTEYAITKKGDTNTTIATYEFLKAEATYLPLKVKFAAGAGLNSGAYGISGELAFEFNIDKTQISDGGTKIIKIPISNEAFVTITVTKPLPPATAPTGITKAGTADFKNRTVTWTITLLSNSETPKWGGYTITDIIDPSQMKLNSIKHGATVLSENTDYQYDVNTGSLIYNIPEDGSRDGKAFNTITIITDILPTLCDANKTVDLVNKATLTNTQTAAVVGAEVTSKVNMPASWITKTGAITQGNRIEWTITVNTHGYTMMNAVVTDTMTAELKLIESTITVDGVQITNSFKPSDDTSYYYLYNATDNSLKIFFPRTDAHLVNKKVIIKLITDTSMNKRAIVLPPEGGYKNKASLVCEYPKGGGTGYTSVDIPNIETTGVSIPDLKISKKALGSTVDNKKSGTINWQINAASNVSEYKYSKITDTLPIGQTFIESTIRCDNVALTTTTTDSVYYEVTNNVNAPSTLTIFFKTDEALKVEKIITFSTQLDKEHYGKNLTAADKFTNSATAYIYSERNFTSTPAKTATSNAEIAIPNTVIKKEVGTYKGTETPFSNDNQNPRIEFDITINSNHMPLTGITITDDLNTIKTTFTPTGGTSTPKNVKWTYVDNSLKVETVGAAENTAETEKAALLAGLSYNANTNTITITPTPGTINGCYKISFAAEIDTMQHTNETMFKTNGTITYSGNKAKIVATELQSGGIEVTANNGTKVNEVLGKKGTVLNDQRQIAWQININQYKYKLDHTAIEDKLMDGLSLDPTSVKLYSGSVMNADGSFKTITGKNLVPSGATLETSDIVTQYPIPGNASAGGNDNTLKIKLPLADASYILIFKTDVDEILNNKLVTNTAYFEGMSTDKGGSDDNDVNMTPDTGGTSTMTGSVAVSKISSDDNTIFLPNTTYKLEWLPGNSKAPVYVRKLTTKNDGKITFKGLTLGLTYRLTEIAAPNGYKIDTASKDFTVASDITGGLHNSKIIFENTPIKSHTYAPTAEKYLAGKDLTTKAFDFELREGTNGKGTLIANGKSSPKKSRTASKISDITFTFQSGKENEFSFSDSHTFLSTDAKGTKYEVSKKNYTLTETTANSDGYTKDATVHALTVTVTNVKGSAALKVVVKDGNDVIYDNSIGKTSPIKFTNTYNATGEAVISGTKTLTGRTLADKQFTFNLQEVDASGTATSGGVTSTTTNNANGNFAFPKISYNETDIDKTHYYKITEQVDADAEQKGYTYDKTAYTVKIDVTDSPNDDGKLVVKTSSITPAPADATRTTIIFKNVYKANDTVSFEATKTLTGYRKLADKQFSYKLENITNGTPVAVETVQNDADGKIKFSDIKYTENDVGKLFTYTIKEVIPAALHLGYTYDETVYTIAVSVFDNEDGTLYTTQSITSKGKSVINGISFTNTYTMTPTTVTFKAQKNVLLGTNKTLPDEQFSFVLKDSTGKVIDTQKNNAKGEVTFKTITYLENLIDRDTHKSAPIKYTISEVNDGVSGYTYDTKVYDIEVTVNDNSDGTMSTAVTVDNAAYNPETGTPLQFTNSYSVSSVNFTPFVTKKVLGHSLEKDYFSFTLEQVADANGTAMDGGIVRNATNAANGDVRFDPIVYTQVNMNNTYYYKVTEDKISRAGYSLDTSTYIITVDVRDNNDGTITAVNNYTKNGVSMSGRTIIFRNSYRTSGQTLEVTATKTLLGKPLQDKQFKYSLSTVGSDGSVKSVLQVATNDATGTIKFKPLNFSQSDINSTKRYAISEINDKKPGYQYDNTVYTLSVSVYDNNNGTISLKTTITKPQSGGTPETVSAVQFSNIYKTVTCDVVLEATKVLDGQELTDKAFTFMLQDGDKTFTTSNDASGKIWFEKLTFTEEDIGKDYNFTLSERSDKAAGYTYDTSVYDVLIKILDGDAGKLKAETTVTKDKKPVNLEEIVFSNNYKATGELNISASKKLLGKKLAANDFVFTLTQDGDVLDTAYNKNDGSIKFKTIKFTEADIGKKYTYNVQELPANDPFIVNDDQIYTLTVEVIDNFDGTLKTETTITGGKDDNGKIQFINKYDKSGASVNPPDVDDITPAETNVTGDITTTTGTTTTHLENEGDGNIDTGYVGGGTVEFETDEYGEIIYPQDDMPPRTGNSSMTPAIILVFVSLATMTIFAKKKTK